MLRKVEPMNGLPAYLVALGVIIVAAAFVYTVVADRGPADETRLAELQESVKSLRGDVADLRIALNGLETAVREGNTVAAKQPPQPVDGGTSSGGTAAADTGVEDSGSPTAAETGEVNTEPVDIVLTVAADGTYTLDGKAVAKDDLEETLKSTLQANPAMQLIVKGGQSASASQLQEALKTANHAGIFRTSVVVAPEE
jgi:biopolymer transport protein ExbD